MNKLALISRYILVVTDENLESSLNMTGINTCEFYPITSNYINQFPSSRFIRNHLPFPNLPPNLLDECKVVYVAQNPKDVAVPWHHHL